MGLRKSLKRQWHELQQEINCVGNSRHEAKMTQKSYCEEQELPWNPLKTIGIYSESTYDTYMDAGSHFIKWLKTEHSEIKDLKEQITKDILKEFIEYKLEDVRSATIKHYQASFNKVFYYSQDLHVTMEDLKDCGWVKDDDIVKNRQEYTVDPQYKVHALLAEATGARRSSLCEVSSKQHNQYPICPESIYKYNNTYYCTLKEKGGLVRNSQIRDDKVDEIKQLFSEKGYEIQEKDHIRSKDEFLKEYKTFSEPFCPKDSLSMDQNVHHLRANYANELYEQFEREKEERGEELKKDCNYKWDKEIVMDVSENLGHSRIDVVVNHYLR